MRVPRVRHLGASLIFLLSAAGPAKPESPGAAARNDAASAFTFRVIQATVTTASQNVFDGVKTDQEAGTAAFVPVSGEPKEGCVFVLLKVEVRNDGAQAATVAYKDLVFRGEDGQPIPWMVLLSNPLFPVPMYIAGATGTELAPHASRTEDFLLSAPISVGAMTLRYGSRPAVPLGVTVPSRFKRWPVRYYYVASAAIGILVLGAFVFLVVRRRNSPEEPVSRLDLR